MKEELHAELAADTEDNLAGGNWWERALCAQADPDAFFPEQGGATLPAKQICAGCPVRAECLEYALLHDERFGIWGGLAERERRRLKKSGGADAAVNEAADQAANDVDEVVVARLVAGHAVPGASRAEVAQAAVALHSSGGLGAPKIAAVLGEHERRVQIWLTRHREGEPLVRRPGPRKGGQTAAEDAA